MREMKDSGVEWIGEIPKVWNVVPNKRIMRKKKDICETYKGESILSLTMNGVIVRDLENPSGKMPLTFDGYQKVKKGNLLMCLFDIDVTPRCIGIINDDGLTSPAYSQFELESDALNRYFYYYYLYLDFTKELLHVSKNLRHSLTESQLGELYVPLPAMDTQHRIADYLDSKCSKIDAIIEREQAVIEKLKEYKLSVITEAVTKGLNPDEDMKDSGVEWIGEVAKDADIIKLKYYSYIKGRIGWQGLKASDFIDKGPYCVTGTDFYDGSINWNTCYHVSEERYEMDSNIQIENGDLLMTKDGTIGKLAIIDELPDKACLNSHLLIIRPLNGKYTNKYLYYVMKSHIFSKYYTIVSSGSTMNSLSQEKTENFSIPAYSIDKQNEIVKYLDDKCIKINNAIKRRTKQLKLLEEYKKSLIYEVVTGKKEV